MTQEALKLALEALKAAQELAGKHDAELEYGFQQAIAALAEALAQQEQEPDYKLLFDELAEKFALLRDEAEMWKKQALFRFDATATPPQRTWVGLEGEEIRNLWEEATKPDRSTMTMVTSFARAIESKMKELNT